MRWDSRARARAQTIWIVAISGSRCHCCFTHSTWHYAQRSQSWKWSDVKKRNRTYATVDSTIRCNVCLFAPHYCVTILFYFYSAVVFAFFYRFFLFFKYDFQYARASCASHAVAIIARPITWAAHLREKIFENAEPPFAWRRINYTQSVMLRS